MKIRILIAGTFSDFIRPNKVSTQQLAAGDVIDYPDWYAGCMVKMKRAEVYADERPLLDITLTAINLAHDLDIDPYTITGSGMGGRITVRDVRKVAG